MIIFIECVMTIWTSSQLVLRDMIDVRDGFKTCAYYTNNDIEDVINDTYLDWNVKLTLFF